MTKQIGKAPKHTIFVLVRIILNRAAATNFRSVSHKNASAGLIDPLFTNCWRLIVFFWLDTYRKAVQKIPVLVRDSTVKILNQ
jgi:hypothetical protein